MQASIKGVSGAWLEQRDPLDLMSAVQGTVGCSSSFLRGFLYLLHLCFIQKGSEEEGRGNVSLTGGPFCNLGASDCISPVMTWNLSLRQSDGLTGDMMGA